jgi:hypothetical protein
LRTVTVKERRTARERDDIERRVRAALELAGLDFAELARKIDQPGYSERSLRNLNAEIPHSKRPGMFAPIAQACGLPLEFFTGAPAEDPADIARLEHKIDDEFAFYRGALERIREQRIRETEQIVAAIRDLQATIHDNQRLLTGLTDSTEQVVRDARRQWAVTLADRLPDADRTPEAVPEPHEQDHAKPAAAQSRGRGTRGSAKRPAG